MSVKSIFFTILGTITVMLVSFFLIELFNISITTMQLQNMAKTSAYQSCTLFTQETYRDDGNMGGATAMSNIFDTDGNMYISGDFYNGNTTTRDIYDSIYNVSNTDFTSAMAPLRGYYTNIDLLMKGIEQNGNVPVVSLDWSSTNADIQANVDANKANLYYNNMYTPANLGVPYLDPDTINRIFKWNLAQLYSNCNSANIKTDENGVQFVGYKGFRCYVQDAQITGINYKVFDLTQNLSATAAELYNYTGLGVRGTPYASGSTGIAVTTTTDLLGRAVKDNAVITAVEIDYTVPIAYEGITPIKSWMHWLYNNDVEGLGGGSIADRYEFDNTAKESLSSSNINASGTIPTSGKLIYVLVK